jgi:hypothetical protein
MGASLDHPGRLFMLSNSVKLIRRHFAGIPISHHFKTDLLTFNQITHSSLLDSANMDEDIPTSVCGLNKAIPYVGIEPLDCAKACTSSDNLRQNAA